MTVITIAGVLNRHMENRIDTVLNDIPQDTELVDIQYYHTIHKVGDNYHTIHYLSPSERREMSTKEFCKRIYDDIISKKKIPFGCSISLSFMWKDYKKNEEYKVSYDLLNL